jgi:hypothetical protein
MVKKGTVMTFPTSANCEQRPLQPPTRHQPPQTQVEQSLDDTINTGGDKRNKYAKLPLSQWPAQHQPLQTNIEQSLDDMIQTAGRGKKENPQNMPQSETPCRWQMTSNGCMNGGCPYKHAPPKISDAKASQGT